MNKYDQQHIANTKAYAKKLEKSFDKVISQVAALANDPSAKFSKSFVFKKNYQLAKSSDLIFSNFKKEMEGIIVSGNVNEWELSNNKNDALVNSYVKNLKVLKEKPDWTDHNLGALKAFTKREVDGISLSDKVWKIVNQAQNELEIHLGWGILNGDSADVISRRIRQNLNEPDALYRRIRNAVGELEWSKAAKALEPKQGKYRSAYKNARRLTITETNMSYRTADQERWNKLGFVLGYMVALSGSHPAIDMCDDLKGEYPKTFVFIGWHPQCLCHAVPIMMTAEQYDKYEDAILDGTDQEYLERIKHIDSVPKGFINWIDKNTERAAGWKSMPYFIRDNYIDGDINKRLNIWPRPVLSDLKTFKNGGSVSIYSTVDRNSNDFNAVSLCCNEFARQGHKTIILPELSTKNPAYERIYNGLMDTKYEGKCPDFKVDDLYYEHEGFTANNPKKNYRNMMNRGIKQSSRIVIEDSGISERYVFNNVLSRISEGQKIDELWLKKDRKLTQIYKKTEAKQ